MSARTKLALVNEGSAGGIRKHILNIARNLDHRQFDIHVILTKRRGYESEGDPSEELQQMGIPFLVLPMVREISPIADYTSRRILQNELRRFDIVHAHSAKAGFLAREICNRLKKPCFYSPHVFPFQRSSAWKAPIYLALERYAVRWTTAFIVNSENEKVAAVQNVGANPDQVHVIPNAILPPDPLPAETFAQIRRELGTKEDCIVFTTVGRLVAYKGHESLIRAFSVLLKRNAELWIVGEGEEASKLGMLTQNLGLEKQVRLLGYRKDIFSILAASNCFVLASKNEGCPYTIIEALAMSKPIIATAVQGVVDLLKNPQYSRLIPWNDSRALSNAFEEFFSTPFPAAPIETIDQKLFDLPGQIRRLEAIYQLKKI